LQHHFGGVCYLEDIKRAIQKWPFLLADDILAKYTRTSAIYLWSPTPYLALTIPTGVTLAATLLIYDSGLSTIWAQITDLEAGRFVGWMTRFNLGLITIPMFRLTPRFVGHLMLRVFDVLLQRL
jgi:hypothetical protein